MNTNYVYTPPSISISAIYGTKKIDIPEGFYMDNFRLVEDGEAFLSKVDVARENGTFSYKHEGIEVSGPRIILKKIKSIPMESVESVYGTSTPVVPSDYIIAGFRPITRGDLFLSKYGPEVFIATDVDVVYHKGGPRLIVEKLSEPVKNVRVVRVLEYIGPKAWIDSTFKCNGVKGLQVVSPTSTIRELSVFKEEVK